MELWIAEQQLQPELISCRLYDSSCDTLVAGHRTRLRTAQSYEFSIYLTDGGALCLPDGDHPITRGLCRFVPPGTQLCSIPHYQSYTVYFSLAPEQGGAFPLCRNPLLDSIPLCFESHFPDSYLRILEKLTEAAFRSEPGGALLQKQLLCQLLLTVRKDVTAADHSASSAIDTVTHYLEEHLCQDVSLETLGELTGYHPLYLQRIFKQHTGRTPHGHLTALRLQKAKELLLATTLPVSQVAQQCGYSSVSHFTSLFKNSTGFPPLTYRKRGRILP